MPNYMVPPASKKQIVMLENMIREVSDLYEVERFPLLNFVEQVLPVVDSSFNFEVVDDFEMGADQANYNPTTNTMKVRESVYIGACNDNGRDRFTLAHEIGHYFMHDTVTLSRVGSNVKIPAYCDSEWQANTFAAALLMPDHIIAGWSVKEIAERCGTSYTAASIAFDNLARKPKKIND